MGTLTRAQRLSSSQLQRKKEGRKVLGTRCENILTDLTPHHQGQIPIGHHVLTVFGESWEMTLSLTIGCHRPRMARTSRCGPAAFCTGMHCPFPPVLIPQVKVLHSSWHTWAQDLCSSTAFTWFSWPSKCACVCVSFTRHLLTTL